MTEKVTGRKSVNLTSTPQSPEPITNWAVGHVKNSSLVALQLNSHSPFLLPIADAKKIGKALLDESEAILPPTLNQDPK